MKSHFQVRSGAGPELRRYLPTLFIIFLFFISSSRSIAGNPAWSTANPFRTGVFVRNEGQFNTWCKSASPVKYAVNNGDLVFFTLKGLVFRLDKAPELDGEEKEEMENRETADFTGSCTYYVSMYWEGANPLVNIEVSTPSEGWYTFGEKGFGNLKIKGYMKLVYKEVYPGIDVEYTIPEKGGIKSAWLVHPGADPSRIKLRYSGDIETIRKDAVGNIRIKTPAGDIIEHSPAAHYEGSQSVAESSYLLKDHQLGFSIAYAYDRTRTLVIDPWTTIPGSLSTTNAAWDVDVDNAGNVYVSGGSYPNKLAKYSSSGSILWTYTNPLLWSNAYPWGTHPYSKFCLLHHSGTTYLAEGWNILGPKVMKLSSGGLVQYTSANFAGSEEIWVMFYNSCTGQLIGFGGGTSHDKNMQVIADTNLSGSTVKNFNGYSGTQNDITSVKMDDNGDFYALMSSVINSCSNHLQKSLASSNYTAPCSFDIFSGYNFHESINAGIPGLHSPSVTETGRSNTVALNQNYLYTYDGKTLKAWNKSTGAMSGSVVVNASYAAGYIRTHEGIVVDKCDRIYVGGLQIVHIYTFNGSSFTSAGSITSNIPGEVYDLVINRQGNMMVVSGYGFLSVVPVTVCGVSQMSISAGIDTCLGDVSIAVQGGSPPYTYQWSNGATGSSLAGIPGGTDLGVTVTDNSCNVLMESLEVTVTRKPGITGTIRYDNVNMTVLDSSLVILKNNAGISISVKPHKHWGGGNSTDGLIIARYAVGLTSLAGLRLMAADVNLSGSVNAGDSYLIMRRWANCISSFVAGDWVAESNNNVTLGNQDVVCNLRALCVGDVNGSYIPGP